MSLLDVFHPRRESEVIVRRWRGWTRPGDTEANRRHTNPDGKAGPRKRPTVIGRRAAPPLFEVTAEEVRADLDAGRSQPQLRPEPRRVPAVARPTLGGPASRRTWLMARALVRLHPRLARRALARLWMTPWVHPTVLTPVDLPPGLQEWSLDWAGGTLRGYAGGSGPTVVVVHGWASRAADWRHLAAVLLGSGWRVVAPDLPAHGASSGSTSNIVELADGLAAVLHHERPVAAVAHSLGFPVLLGALSRTRPPPPVQAVVAVAPVRSMRHSLERFAVRSRLGPRLTRELCRAMQARFGTDVWDAFDADRFLTDLPTTGLVIHDVDDEDVAIEDAMAIAGSWPGAALVATRGLGHRRVLRDPDVHGLVVSSLDQVLGAAPMAETGAP